MKTKNTLRKTKVPSNKITLLSGLVIIFTAVGGGWIFWQKNLQTQRKIQIKKSTQEYSKLDEAKDDYLQHLHKKINFIATLVEKSNQAESYKELKGQLQWLSEIRLNSQDDFDRIEALQSQIGDKIVAEIQCFNSNQECELVSSYETIRELERLDRRIDMSRLALSAVTYKISKIEKGLRTSTKKNSQKALVPHFKVDHLILGRK